MTLGLTFLSIKIVSLHRQEHGCSSELLRCNASNAGTEIKSTIPAFQRSVALVSYCEPGLRCEMLMPRIPTKYNIVGLHVPSPKAYLCHLCCVGECMLM